MLHAFLQCQSSQIQSNVHIGIGIAMDMYVHGNILKIYFGIRLEFPLSVQSCYCKYRHLLMTLLPRHQLSKSERAREQALFSSALAA